MAHGVEVAKALWKLEAGSKERVLQAQNLDHSTRPADALADVSREAFGSQPRSLGNVDVSRVPAGHLHAQRGVRVFGHGLLGDAADLVERGTAQNSAGAAEESCVPEVIAVLDHSVEELAFVGDQVELLEIAFEGVGRIKVVRRLHHRQLGVTQEPAYGHLQKAARGDVIGIEDGHQRR